MAKCLYLNESGGSVKLLIKVMQIKKVLIEFSLYFSYSSTGRIEKQRISLTKRSVKKIAESIK